MPKNLSPCDFVSKIPLLEKYCTPLQKSFLHNAVVCDRHKKGDIIFHEDHPASYVYFVRSGYVALWKENIYAKKQYIRFAKCGELFGFRGSTIDKTTYRLSASAFEDSEICYVRKDEFIQLLKENPELQLNILLSYVKELEKIETNFCYQLSMNSREKIAEALLTINSHFGCNGDSAPFSKSICRQDIADIAGISVGKTINMLTEFRSENIIDTNGSRSTITLLNPDKLNEIVAKYH